MNGHTYPSRRITLRLAGLMAVASAIVALAACGTSTGSAATSRAHAATAPTTTRKQLALHDTMRELWEFHGAWTRMAIDNFVGNNPDFPATAQTLLQNQVDIGNAIKPFYGVAAGNMLTKLLKAHINGAVAILQAAKSGDPSKLTQADAAWYVNGNQIAVFLHSANPRFWPLAAMRSMMKIHLNQVIKQAVDELHGDYAASASDYSGYNAHLLVMADMLSSGIVKQFPGDFR